MMSLLRKLVPQPIIKAYHYLLAKAATFFYNRPADKLIVIGVTGTSGKSTVVYLISKLLEQSGFKVGAASTIMFKIGKKEWLNDKKMTMLGRFALQRMIKQMVKANCQYAVIETTSQGIEQFRHLGISYDVVVFTNLYPEHIEAHGSFENYKNAKLKLFKKLKQDKKKKIAGQKVAKTIVGNLDDEHAKDFLGNWADQKFGITLENKKMSDVSTFAASDITETARGVEFAVNGQKFTAPLLGHHNIYNVLTAIAVASSQNLSLEGLVRHVAKLPGVPGRLEFIDEGQDFSVVVDYAFEPRAIEALYNVVNKVEHKRIIHVLGGTGGGRDKARRPALGEFAGAHANVVIVTNEDPYDEDPMDIIKQVAEGAYQAGKERDKNLFTILNRREAIRKALSLARKDDIVLITGKGSEQAIVTKNNRLIPWDDRTVAREEIKKLSS